MTLNANDTTMFERLRGTDRSLLWLPYLIISLICVLALAINFWFYHRKRRLQYERKFELEETRDSVQEHRIILKLEKDKCTTVLLDNNDLCMYGSTEDIYYDQNKHRYSDRGVANL